MCRHQPRGKPLLEKKPSLLCGSVRASERRRGRPPDGPVSALVFRVNVLLPHPPKPLRRPCMEWGLAAEDAMRKLGLNEKRTRTKTVRRQLWAMRLLRQSTLKTVVSCGRVVVTPIGSASCSVSVCLSVYISVYSVAFKKNPH